MDARNRIHLLPNSAYTIPFSLFPEDVFVITALPDRRTLPKQAFAYVTTVTKYAPGWV